MGARGRGSVFGCGSRGRGGASKVYCARCNAVFGSRSEYERHLDRHARGGPQGEACPLDTAVSRLLGIFSRRR